jgi:hypothetical protein
MAWSSLDAMKPNMSKPARVGWQSNQDQFARLRFRLPASRGLTGRDAFAYSPAVRQVSGLGLVRFRPAFAGERGAEALAVDDRGARACRRSRRETDHVESAFRSACDL